MSANITEVIVTSTPLPFSQIPMQLIVLVTAVIITGLAFIVIVLWFAKFYQNVGTKVRFLFYQTPDKRIRIRYAFHEIGPNAIGTTVTTTKEASDLVDAILEETFKK